jgi:hypothetical protein
MATDNFELIVQATRAALEAFALTDSVSVVVKADPEGGLRSVSLNDVVLVEEDFSRDAVDLKGWMLSIRGDDGEYAVFADMLSDPIEVVKLAVEELISGKVESFLTEVLAVFKANQEVTPDA